MLMLRLYFILFFHRYYSYFTERYISDNACINLLEVGDQLYAMTETRRVKRISPEDLSTVGEVGQ